eukprot:2114354-Prymnesium_polylepis.1
MVALRVMPCALAATSNALAAPVPYASVDETTDTVEYCSRFTRMSAMASVFDSSDAVDTDAIRVRSARRCMRTNSVWLSSRHEC